MDFATARATMVDSQVRPDNVSDPSIVSAFLRTPRELFVPESRRSLAYGELEIETSPGRSLWIARDTAKLIRLANVKPTDSVLVIGAGAGYEAVLLSYLAARVVALDETADLAEALTLRAAGLGIDRITTETAPLADGGKQNAPFDVIFVCGMVEMVPHNWKAQLADGGRLAVVVQENQRPGRGRVYTAAREGFDASPPRFAAFDRPFAFRF
jgi:protein-L-isoaspartate(D-aspartate) O-methyltransferase